MGVNLLIISPLPSPVTLLMAAYCLIRWLYYILFNQSSVAEHLAYFQFFTVLDHTAMNILMGEFVHVCDDCFNGQVHIFLRLSLHEARLCRRSISWAPEKQSGV